MTIEAMKQALEALEEIHAGNMTPMAEEAWNKAITSLRQAIAEAEKQEPVGEPVAWTENDMAYRPNGLPQEFIHHEVESPDDWSEWVCPKPEQYFMKCCDCGLVHEAQFRVAKYGEGDYCELVEDKDTQAQFRMRRRTTPQPKREWVGLTDEEMEAIWKNAGWYVTMFKSIEAKLKEKNNG